MKLELSIVGVVIFFVFCGCNGTQNISGTFVRSYGKVIGGMEFKITKEPNEFYYEESGDMGLAEQSKGGWIRNGSKLVLSGYNDQNINLLEIKTDFKENTANLPDMITVQYHRDIFDTSIKVDLWINNEIKVRISGDTSLAMESEVKNLRIKSYLEHNGFSYGNPIRIDTLYSSIIDVNSAENRSNEINIKFDVDLASFYRVKLSDTLIIKSKKVLQWHNALFKKQKKRFEDK
jgi:hypothetical protein